MIVELEIGKRSKKTPIPLITIIILLTILATIPANAASQPQSTRNTILYGTNANDYNWVTLPDPRGGFTYFITTQAYTTSHGAYDGYLWYTWINRTGSLKTSILIKPPGGGTGYFYSAARNSEGYMVVGFPTTYRIGWIIQLHENGSLAYWLDVKPSGSYYYIMLSVAASGPDNNTVVAGVFYQSGYKMVLAKINASTGTLEWATQIGLPGYYFPFGATVYNNTVVISAYSYTGNPMLIAVNYTSGVLEWARTYDFSFQAYFYRVTADSTGIYVTGAIEDSSGLKDPLVAGIAWNGSLKWAYRIGSPGEDWMMGIYLDTVNETIYASGFINPGTPGSVNKTLIVAVRSNGSVLFSKSIETESTGLYVYSLYMDGTGRLYLEGSMKPGGQDDILQLTMENGVLLDCPFTIRTQPPVNITASSTLLALSSSAASLLVQPDTPIVAPLPLGSVHIEESCWVYTVGGYLVGGGSSLWVLLVIGLLLIASSKYLINNKK